VRVRLLLVEDEPGMAAALTRGLAAEGYVVDHVADGPGGLEAARFGAYDVVLLDIMLPGMSGIEVLRVMRTEGIATPVIIVSAKGGESDRVVGLKLGADDYVTKPFSRPELLARIEAVLRRGRRPAATKLECGIVHAGSLAVDTGRRAVSIDGTGIDVTMREFDLLAHLAREPERIFSRDQLLAAVWGLDYAGEERTVDVHISWLRKKMRAVDGHDWFRTVRGIGYALSPPQR
jgi:DNA-binding response OmpR family regulator